MTCTGCGAPVADSLHVCPYCGARITFEALGMTGGLSREARGGLRVEGDAHVVVGVSEGPPRPCPFCGGPSARNDETCPHCGSRLILRSLWLRRLVVSGGGRLTVHAEGRVSIGRPPAAPGLLDASLRGDVAAVRARIEAGDELDGAGADGLSALHLAAARGHTDVVRYLAAMGATLDDKDAEGRTRTPRLPTSPCCDINSNSDTD